MPTKISPAQAGQHDRSTRKDLRTLALFVDLYCKHQHASAQRGRFALNTLDVTDITGSEIELCCECRKLLAHAMTKRSHCPLDPKPACKDCPVHCYAPHYRQQIQEVMRYSGRHMVLRGRVDYLLKLLF